MLGGSDRGMLPGKILKSLRYVTISSIKKIIHFEVFIWIGMQYYLFFQYITDIIQRTLFMSQNCV